MRTPNISTYLGDQIRDRNEVRFLEQFRADLSRRGASATIYANFIADPRNEARQIDFLVLTQQRLVHIELKTLRQDSPVHAAANGPWRQLLPGDQTNSWKNAYRQAQGATYAISDDVRRLVKAGKLPDTGARFFEHIDTVVCLFPEIPRQSAIERHRYVAVCGYQALIDRVVTPGPHPSGWTSSDATTLARELGLYAEPDDDEADSRRTQDLNALADYRSRFIQDHSANLHPLVPIAAIDSDNDDQLTPLDTVMGAICASEALVFTGESGGGKSHVVRHAVLQTARRQAVPIWLNCGDYEGDTFTVAMAKAAARFTAEPWNQLFERANRHGIVPVIVLDGLDGCSPNQQRILLEGASSYHLTRGCALVVTTHEPRSLASARSLRALPPSPSEREALLASYGAPELSSAEAFRTPWELAMAAQCATDIGADASPSELFELYVRRRTASESQRDQLRALAIAMQNSLRPSLPMAQIRPAIGELADRPPTADEIDALLSCSLLSLSPQRVSFAHETLGKFLAAQHLLLTASNANELAVLLAQPALAGLRELTLEAEPDSVRRADTLIHLAHAGLIAKAARGGYGPHTEARIRAAMQRALSTAADVTSGARFIYNDDLDKASVIAGHWSLPAPISKSDAALLTACGMVLADDVITADIVHLLDSTDAHCATAMRDLRDRGVKAPISAIGAVTYTPGLSYHAPDDATNQSGPADLPATIVLRACASERFRLFGAQDQEPRGTRVRFAADAPARWGRMLAALTVLNAGSPEDLALVPQLIAQAWDLGGYHFRLNALEVAHGVARHLSGESLNELRSVLEDFDVSDNWALSSLLVEALAACGGIQPLFTAADIRDEIANVLGRPSDPDAQAIARSILGRLFEDEAIFGPHSEVIGALDPSDLIRLCGMSLRDKDARISITRDWAVGRIADHIVLAGPSLRKQLQEIAAAPPLDSFVTHEGLRAHIAALRGWSQISHQLPDAVSDLGDVAARTWRRIDELIFPSLRGQKIPTDAAETAWNELSGPCKPNAVDALLQLRMLGTWDGDSAASLYPDLLEAFPERFRALYEWALEYWHEVRPATGTHLLARREVVVRELGAIGDARSQSLLRNYLNESEISSAVVDSIREIEARNS
jgi:hypothetical protein